MEIHAIVRDGQVRLPASVHVPDGTEVCVVVPDQCLEQTTPTSPPIENEPLDEAELMADLRWATGRQFS